MYISDSAQQVEQLKGKEPVMTDSLVLVSTIVKEEIIVDKILIDRMREYERYFLT